MLQTYIETRRSKTKPYETNLQCAVMRTIVGSIRCYFKHSVNVWFTKWRHQTLQVVTKEEQMQNSAVCLLRLNCFRKLFWVHIAKKSGQKLNSKRQNTFLLFYFSTILISKHVLHATHRDSLTNMCILHVPAGVHILEIVWNNMKWSWMVVVYRCPITYHTVPWVTCSVQWPVLTRCFFLVSDPRSCQQMNLWL